MDKLYRRMNDQLLAREMNNCLRFLQESDSKVDFCSNDYLGFSRCEALPIRATEILNTYNFSRNGSTGSRLISGSSKLTKDTESLLADFFKTPAALLFNSGYDANIGLFSAVPRRNDLILYDELIHASVRDGIRLSFARSLAFRHNDLRHLSQLLAKHRVETVFVAVESLYSMDGDAPDLHELHRICKEFSANLIVDEAHATGVLGSKGRGLVCEAGLENEVFARLHTFGKALGGHGAAIVGSELLKSYLINFSRSFIYTTALPPYTSAYLIAAIELLGKDHEQLIVPLKNNINLFRSLIQAEWISGSTDFSPIQSVEAPGNDRILKIANILQSQGFDVKPMRSPTVPAGTERLRITLHTYNNDNEIIELCDLINNLMENFC